MAVIAYAFGMFLLSGLQLKLAAGNRRECQTDLAKHAAPRYPIDLTQLISVVRHFLSSSLRPGIRRRARPGH